MSNALGMSVRLGVVAVALLAVPLSNQAAAQERPRPAVELAAGSVVSIDDSIHETLVGGAARFYLLPRVSVGPEVAYIRGPRNHSHLILTGNVTFDFLRPVNGQPRRVTPYVVVGGGLFQTRDQFLRGTLTSSEGTFTAGGGVRALVGDRVTVGAEARTGWKPPLRLSGTVGVLLGR